MASQQSIEELKLQISELKRELHRCQEQLRYGKKNTNSAIQCTCDQILSAILIHSQDSITVRSCPDGRYLMANAKFCSDMNLQLNDIIGKSYDDLLPQDLAKSNFENDEKVIRQKKPLTMQWHIKGKDREIDKFVNKFPIINDANEVVAIGNIASDISNQVYAEKKWQESENLFRKTFYTMPEAINLSRASDGLFIDINEGFTNLTGFTREDILGKTSSEINLWKNIDDRTRLLEGLMGNGHVNNFETELIKKNGKTGIGLISARILKIQDEDYIISVTRDITQQKQMEEALRENEQRFKDLAELLPEAIFETDDQLKITYVNQRAAELLGISEHELITYNSFDFFSKEDQDRITKNLKDSQRSEKIKQLEYQILKKDGTSFPVIFNSSLIYKDGRFAGVRGIFFDLTNQKKAKKERKALEAQFLQAQKLEAVGRLAGGVAHDLNNLLSPILGYSELMLLELDPDDKLRAHPQQIINVSLKARDLIHQLLAYSRKQALDYRPVDLNTVLKNLQNILRRTIREDIDLILNLSPKSQSVKVDTGQIEQVIMNLCVNAQDAMPNGGRLILETDIVEIDQTYANNLPGVTPGRYMLMSVNDTGIGMDEKTRSLIFEPFFSTKGKQGTGLGLATAYGIVRQHGGNIWVYSEPNVGTSFKVYLPVSNEPSEIIQNNSKPTLDQKWSETILVVDDNQTVITVVREMLEQFGYTILTTDNSTEALVLLDQNSGDVDLLITDVVMPEMNGKELYERALEKKPDIKVIYMSGYLDDIIANHGILEHGVKFIQKPFTIQSLLTKIREAVEES